jgi:phage-related tail fiber protein
MVMNGKALSHCPHCHQPITTARLGMRLSALKAGIFDRIKAAGDIGITTTELINGDLYCDRRLVGPAAIKSHVWQINEMLDGTGWRIASDRRRWTLVKETT